MRIKVINKAKGLWPRKLQYLVMGAVGFAMDYHDIRNDHLKLEVKFAYYNDHREYMGGAAYNLDNGRFLIQLNLHPYDTWEDLISAVMHEMTHVKQFIRNGFDSVYDNDFIVVQWEGAKFLLHPEAADQHYPWEKEAYAIEGVMLEEFLKTL